MKIKLLLLSLVLLMGESMSAQLVLQICTPQLPCPGFPLGSVQAGVDQNGWRNFKVTLTQNVSLFSIVGVPPPSQASVNVIFTQDATGGRTVTFASNITNPCTIATGANATTLCQFEFDGIAGIWFGISGGGGTPGGANTQIQFNNSGVFGGLSNVAAGSALVSNGVSSSPIFQKKPIIDVRDLGVDCTGSVDASTILNALTGTSPGTNDAIDGASLVFPKNCIIKLTNTWLIKNQSGFAIDCLTRSGASAAGPRFTWAGGAGGTMIDMEFVDGFEMRGCVIDGGGNSGADVGINIDKNGLGGTTNTTDGRWVNMTFISGFLGGGRTNWIGLAMSLVSLSNVEDMRVEDSSVYCNGTAGGNEVGFEIGPSANAKNEIFKHNNIHTCQFGIYQKSGSMHVLDSEFSSNGGTCGSGTGSDIRIDGTTDVDIIEGNLNEGSTQFINTNNDSGSFGPQHPIIITGNHAAPAGCENTANYWINTANSAVPWFIVANSWDADNNLVKLIGTNLAAGGQATIYAHSNAYPNFLFNQWWAQGNTTISDDLQILQVPMIVGHRVNNGNIPALGNSEPSNFISFRGYFSGSAFNLDDYAIQNIPGGGGSSSVGGTFLIKHQQGVTGTEAFAFDGSYSGISIISMTTPVAPGVTPIGGTGATSYTYAIVAYNSVGNTIGGATTNITNGVAFASLSSTVYNQITFLAQPGATKYCIWRTVGGTTQGNIGCTSALMTIPSASLTLTSACCFAGAPGFAANSSDTQYIFKDTGLAGDSSALPTLNSTGGLQLASSTFANLPTVASGTMLYCSDCKNVTDDTTGTFDSAAASGGHGTMVLRENGAWRVH